MKRASKLPAVLQVSNETPDEQQHPDQPDNKTGRQHDHRHAQPKTDDHEGKPGQDSQHVAEYAFASCQEGSSSPSPSCLHQRGIGVPQTLLSSSNTGISQVPVELGVPGVIHQAHAALADEGGHLVMAEAGTDG